MPAQLRFPMLQKTFYHARCSLAAILLVATSARANNLTVSAGSLVDNTGTTVQVQFNVSWENSWRINPDRWDAAWVFVKYRTTDGLWHHASLNCCGHVAPEGCTLTPGLLLYGADYDAVSNPGVGAFIYRSADGSGTFSATGVQLQWNYSTNNVNLANVLEVRMFAIEMVSVPQGAFAMGSGGSEASTFALTTISTANAQQAPTGVGALGGQAGGYPTGQFTPPFSYWPNGFNAFYCMKYELSQQGYVDFLNTLTYDQQAARTRIPPTVPNNLVLVVGGPSNQMRNGVEVQTAGVSNATPAVYACDLNRNGTFNEAVDGQNLACNYLSWADQAAYLDWSCLRIMTEFEYEKACRGTDLPVANGYAWGTTGIGGGSNYTLSNSGMLSETIATNYSTAGNATYGAALPSGGPLREGIFAANGANTGRMTAGGGAYGIMELAGNLAERIVEYGSSSGRAYTGAHGNGSLTAAGASDVPSWTNTNFNLRGGAWHTSVTTLRISDRFYSDVNTGNALGDQAAGCRGVRNQ
jgi:formylglycine-generating enzyme required for sulfatase activity